VNEVFKRIWTAEATDKQAQQRDCLATRELNCGVRAARGALRHWKSSTVFPKQSGLDVDVP
jgi:hypothetical protein